MPENPIYDQPGWRPQTVYNVAGNLNQGAAADNTAAPLSVIPYPRNQVFLGRDDEQRGIGEWLARPGAAVAIAGLGGVGKTQLAAEFAHQCADDRATWPGGVSWIPMLDPTSAGTAVAASGRGLGIPGYDALPYPQQVEAVRRAWAGPERRLLVFDNCEDPALLKEWRPASGGARILLTTRRADWPSSAARTLKLGELPRTAARELLCGGRAATLGIPLDKLAADPAADAICAQLGDLALAIHMAAAYLAQRPLVPLAAFLADLKAQPLDHEALRTLDQDSPTEHLHHVAQTIELSYKLLEEPNDLYGGSSVAAPVAAPDEEKAAHAEEKPLSPNALARHLLDLAAHCAPGAPIPLDLLRRAAQSRMEEESIQNPKSKIQNPTDAAIQRLVTIGLASYADEGSALYVHRLVAAFARKQQDDAAAVETADTVAGVLGWMTKEMDDAGLPGRMTPLLAHAQHAAEAAEQRGSEHAATLLNNLGYHLASIADYANARALYERALRIDEAAFGPDHPEVAIDVNNLGSVAKEQGDLPAARALYERALRIDEATFGPDHPNVAIRVNNLGSVAKEQGDLPAARLYLERALRIDEATFGPDHPKVAIRVNNLGSVAKEQGDLPAAHALYERALRIFEQKLGPEHPNTRIVRANLAGILAALGDRTRNSGTAEVVE